MNVLTMLLMKQKVIMRNKYFSKNMQLFVVMIIMLNMIIINQLTRKLNNDIIFNI